MLPNRLRAVVAALALGTATVAVTGLVTVIPAEAAVRPAVGKPLQEAKSLAGSGNYSAALARVREAESVGGLSGEERSVINQMKEYINIKAGGAGDVNSGAGMKAKFANDYRAGRYGEVIRDQEGLRKYGVLDGQSMHVIAQAYYQLHDYAGCLHYIKNNLGYGAATQLAMVCASESGDQDALRQLSRDAVLAAPTPENWNHLIRYAQSAKGLGDHETLDLYRIKKLTGTLSGESDYSLLAELALQFGSSAEALAVTESGIQAKALVGDRWNRLLGVARKQSGDAAANFPKNLASARAEKRGDDLMRLGEYEVGAGKAADGAALIQEAIGKGTADPGAAKLRLGYAQLMAHQKDAAIRTFNSVKETPNQDSIAQIWVIYAKTTK